MKSVVKLTATGVGSGEVFIDGVQIKAVKAIRTQLRAGEPAEVGIELAMPSLDEIEFTEAGIVVDKVYMPKSVEMALYHYLAIKHGPLEMDVSTLGADIQSSVLISS